jgi:hypothetical protein
MKRGAVLCLVGLLLFGPSLGSANPSGVGEGTFDAQCGGACHGDADMNKSSPATVTVLAPAVAYEGLLTSVSVTVTDIETTTNGLLGVFLLSDLSGAGDTPADDGWNVVSNSEGGTENYVEVSVAAGVTEHTVSWTLNAPSLGTYPLYAAVHHGTQDGSNAPFFGASTGAVNVEVRPVPENLPRVAADFTPTTEAILGSPTQMTLETEFVEALAIQWRVAGGEPVEVNATQTENGVWAFTLPSSVQPVVIEWRAHLSGEGPSQTTPWFQVRSDAPAWTVDETTAYVQSIAMLLAAMAAFVALQHRVPLSAGKTYEADVDEDGGAF